MLKAGTYIRKQDGDYTFEGIIVAAFKKKSGAERYVVENDAGILLIMSEKQFKIIEESK